MIGPTATADFAYDPFNRLTAVTDPNGVTTETQYDALDRVRKVIQRAGTLAIDFNPGDPPQAGDLVTESVYNVFGDLFRTILPELNVIEYGYDAAGRLETIARRPDTASPIAAVVTWVSRRPAMTRRSDLTIPMVPPLRDIRPMVPPISKAMINST